MTNPLPSKAAGTTLTAGEVADLIGGRMDGDPGVEVSGLAPIQQAGPGSLGFLADRRYLKFLPDTRAGTLLVSEALSGEAAGHPSRVVAEDAHAAMATLLEVFYPAWEIPPGIHATAVIAPSATLGEEITVGPYAVVEDDVVVGDRVRILSHSCIGRGCRIGDDSLLHPHVVLYPGCEVGRRVVLHAGARIGADGFGYAFVDGAHRKIPQVGGCVIEDDVEIGANTCLDRGSIGETRVGQGTKLDNLVQIAHNVQMGPLCLAAALVGIAGSTRLGKGVMFGGQAGIIGHLEVGDGASLAAASAATTDIPPGEVFSGFPARPNAAFNRAQGYMYRLRDLFKRVKELERVVDDLQEASGEDEGDGA